MERPIHVRREHQLAVSLFKNVCAWVVMSFCSTPYFLGLPKGKRPRSQAWPLLPCPCSYPALRLPLPGLPPCSSPVLWDTKTSEIHLVKQVLRKLNQPTGRENGTSTCASSYLSCSWSNLIKRAADQPLRCKEVQAGAMQLACLSVFVPSSRPK